MFQEIKDVPIDNNKMKELCLKKLSRKKKDPPIVHVVGQITYIVLGRIIVPKYMNPNNHVVNVNINRILIPNTLIELAVAINLMTRETI